MSLLAQLASELNVTPDQLRSLILAGDETLQVNYLQTDPTGNVQFVFPGGVILPSSTSQFASSQAVPDASAVTWETAAGGFVAQIANDTVSGSNQPETYIKTQTPNNSQFVHIIQLIDNNTPGNTRITVRAAGPSGDNTRTLIRENGSGEFVTYPPGMSVKADLIAAVINGSSGGVIAQTGGVAGTIKLGTGSYRLIFSDTITVARYQFIQPNSGTGAFGAEVTGATATTVDYFIFNSAGGPVDTDHSILVLNQ